MSRYFTGIGSRKTPPDILDEMSVWAFKLAEMGFTLRSGAADGADRAFEDGCDMAKGNKQIYLPWKGFNGSTSPLFGVDAKACEVAEQFYGPRWKYLSHGSKMLQARNTYQVSGKNLDVESEFVICWTPDGCTRKAERTRETGGTGQAIAIASAFSIPIFNLQKPMESQLLYEFLEKYK